MSRVMKYEMMDERIEHHPQKLKQIYLKPTVPFINTTKRQIFVALNVREKKLFYDFTSNFHELVDFLIF
jgi:hypothetical protein